VPVAAVVSRTAPHADPGPPIDDVTVLRDVDEAPRDIAFPPPGEVERAIAIRRRARP
jgi:hypothetical protein